MAEPADEHGEPGPDPGDERPTGEPTPEPSGEGPTDLLQRLGLMAFGALSIAADRVEGLAGELVGQGSVRRDEVRTAAEDMATRWRGDATRLTERASVNLATLFSQIGLVTRAEVEELELRVAQLEHRLRLLEGAPPPPPPAPRSAA
jgi:polyhydroxyalkanoate synthesis regulator phasin